jgi:hypothetical protein
MRREPLDGHKMGSGRLSQTDPIPQIVPVSTSNAGM